MTFDSAWSSSDPAVATVSNADSNKGFTQGLTVGTTTIQALFGTASDSTQLTITPAILTTLKVTPANTSIVGFAKTVNFVANGTYSDGTTAVLTTQVAWASSIPGVATIATSGVATTVAAGTTSISATLNGISDKTDLKVLALVLNLTPASQTLTVGQTVQFNLVATSADNTTQNVNATSVWASNATNIATVINSGTNNGLATAVAIGSATISATYGGQTVTAVVTVQ
jgi:hypothetical protein